MESVIAFLEIEVVVILTAALYYYYYYYHHYHDSYHNLHFMEWEKSVAFYLMIN